MKKLILKLLDIYKGLSTPAKASLWFLFCNVLQMGLNVLSTPIFTRLMSTDEFGVVNTFNSWRSILMIFTSLNLSYGVFNNAMVRYEDDKTRNQYVSSMQGLYCMITGGFFIFYLFTQKWCNQMLGMSTPVVILLFLDLLCYPALLFWSGRQRYEFKYQWLVVVTILMTVANIGIGIAAVALSEHKDIAKIGSGVLVNVVFCGFFLIYQFVKGRKLCVPKFWKFALKFNIPLIPHYLSEMILNQSDRIMIAKYDGNTATANYSIAHSVIMIMQMVMSAVNASFLPWSYNCLKHKKYDEIKKMANLLILLMAGCIFLVMMFVPEIIYLFAGSKYADAVYVIPPIALSVFFMFLYDLFSTVEFYYGENIFVMIASVLAAALNVFLNWIFIPMFGYYAAGYTTLFCYFTYALGHYFFYRVVCRRQMEGQRIYDEKWILLLAVVMFVITLAVNMIYDKILVRYGIAVVLVIIFIWKRNVILDKFKQMKAKEE